MGGSSSKDGGKEGSSKKTGGFHSVKPSKVTTGSTQVPTSSFQSVNYFSGQNQRKHNGNLTVGQDIEGYCNTYIRTVLCAEQLQFVVEEFEELETSVKLLQRSKITEVACLVHKVLADSHGSGLVSPKNPALQELTKITLECYARIQQDHQITPDIGALFQNLLMSSVKVLRMPISETLSPKTEIMEFAEAIKQMMDCPAEDYEGSNMEPLYRAVAQDILSMSTSSATSMDIENLAGVLAQAKAKLETLSLNENSVAQFANSRRAWQRYIHTQEEAIEEPPMFYGFIHAQRKYILKEIKGKYFDLGLVCPTGYSVQGLFSLANFEISSNLGLGFVSLFPDGFGNAGVELLPTMGNVNVQVMFADGSFKNCTMKSIKDFEVANSCTQISRKDLCEYLPKVSDLVHKFVPYLDIGDLEADFEAILLFEHQGRYHLRTKKESVVDLERPARLELYRLFFFAPQHAPQSEQSISVVVRNMGMTDGMTENALLMYFEPTDTLSNIFEKLALNYYGVDSSQLLDTDLVDRLMENLFFTRSSTVSALEVNSLKAKWTKSLRLGTTWAKIVELAGCDSDRDQKTVDLVAFFDLEKLSLVEIIAPYRFDNDLMEDPTEPLKRIPSMKLNYYSIFNLFLRAQGLSAEKCAEEPESKIISLLPSQLIVPFSEIPSLFELPTHFEVGVLAEAARNLAISHAYKPKAYFFVSESGHYLVAQVIPETKGRLRYLNKDQVVEIERDEIRPESVKAVLFERLIPDL